MLQMINLMKQPTPDGAPIGQVVLIVMAIILVVSYWVHTVVTEKKGTACGNRRQQQKNLKFGLLTLYHGSVGNVK